MSDTEDFLDRLKALVKDDWVKRLQKLEQDMWFGNGKPAVTIRIQRFEDRQEDFEEAIRKEVADVRDTVIQIRSDLRKVVWFVLAAVLAEVLKLIFVRGL